jgi:hypothetical protein
MNLKAKIHVEIQKKTAEEKLSARQTILADRGLDNAAVKRDPIYRKLSADVRKANSRLSAIAAQEALNADRAKAKAKKQAAKKGEQKKSKKTDQKKPKAAGKKSPAKNSKKAKAKKKK